MEQGINCPIYRCRYIETTLKTTEGHQAWEVLLKLSEPNFSEALEIAKHLNFDMELMTELLSSGIQGLKAGLSDMTKDDFPKI